MGTEFDDQFLSSTPSRKPSKPSRAELEAENARLRALLSPDGALVNAFDRNFDGDGYSGIAKGTLRKFIQKIVASALSASDEAAKAQTKKEN